VAVVKAEVVAAVERVRAGDRVEEEDRAAATVGGLVAEVIGSFRTAGGRRVRPPALSWVLARPACFSGLRSAAKRSALRPELRVNWQ
jgi:hypothetical protein